MAVVDYYGMGNHWMGDDGTGGGGASSAWTKRMAWASNELEKFRTRAPGVYMDGTC